MSQQFTHAYIVSQIKPQWDADTGIPYCRDDCPLRTANAVDASAYPAAMQMHGACYYAALAGLSTFSEHCDACIYCGESAGCEVCMPAVSNLMTRKVV